MTLQNIDFYKSIEEIFSQTLEGSFETIGEELAGKIKDFFRAYGYSLFFLKEPEQISSLWTDGISDEYRSFLLKNAEKLPGTEAYLKGEVLISNDIDSDPKFKKIRKRLREERVKSIIIYPLKFQNRIIGVLTLYFSNKRKFTEEEVLIGKIFSSFLASFLNNLKLFQKLKENEKRLAQIFYKSPAAIALIQNNKFVLTNPVFQEITGYSSEEARRLNFWEIVHPDDRKMVKERGLKRERGEKVYPDTYEFRIISKDGSVKWVEFKGTPTELDGKPANLVIALDVTQRKKLEEEVNLLQENLKTIYEHSVMGIYLASVGEGKMVYEMINPKGKEILGLDIEGKTPEDVFPHDEALKAKRIVEIIRKTKRPLITREEYYTALGKRILFVSRAPIFDKNGNVIKIVGLFRDITEEEKAKEESEKRSKLELLGKLAGGIAHEFNNLLSIVLTTVEMELCKNPHHPSWSKIKKKTIQASRMVSEIMELGEGASAEMTTVNLSLLLKDYIEFLQKILPERISLEVNIENNSLYIKGNPQQIKILINNLVLNSKEAIDLYGTIKIRLRKLKGKELKKAKEILPAEGIVELTVEDTGKGMNERVQKMAFEPFFTTKLNGERSGVGLYRAYSIVQIHRGDIKIESYPGKGTRITVLLPLISTKKDKRKVSTTSSARKGVILLVEDDPEVLEVEKEILSFLGYKTMSAKDGREAIEIFTKNKKKIIGVITDLSMPKMGGLQLAKVIKEISPDTRVIIISGYITREEMLYIEKEKIDGVIQKPFELEKFAEKLKSIIG